MLAIDGDLSRRAECEPGHHSDVDGQNHHGHRNGHTENVERGQIAEVDQQILQVVHVLVLLIDWLCDMCEQQWTGCISAL